MNFDMKNPETWIDRETFELYIGENNEKLLKYYDKAVAAKSIGKLSFNLFAFLFFPAWCAYRRQWPILWIFLAIHLGIIVLESMAGTDFLTGSSQTSVHFGLSFLANGFVLQAGTRKFHRLKSQGMSIEQIRQEMKDKATPSTKNAVLVALPFIAAAVLAYVL